jgi:hypothetical protein
MYHDFIFLLPYRSVPKIVVFSTMSFVPVPLSSVDMKLFFVFVYEQLDQSLLEATPITNIMKFKKPFDKGRKPYVTDYHVLEVCSKQILASQDAHIVSFLCLFSFMALGFLFFVLHRFTLSAGTVCPVGCS